jgi:hypothetical protein
LPTVALSAKVAPAITFCAVMGNSVTAMGGRLTATVTDAFFVESATEATVMLAVHA